ncbi:MAG: PAS domain-containing protein [Alphaproteobacteria bacterium]|nr:PAS domain-containing protein [Alphaproteobacteria bacterium]
MNPNPVSAGDPAAVIGDARLEGIYHYWRRKCAGRPMPSRADIDPVELSATVWPYIMILEVVRASGVIRFRYRRVGEVFWRATGREPTGQFLDESVPDIASYRQYVVGVYREMIERRQPLYTQNFLFLEGQRAPMQVKRVSLPLSSDGATIDMILAGHVFDHESCERDWALSKVSQMQEGDRIFLVA